VIEKAYALKIGSYDDLDDDTKHTVNEFWAVLVGAKPDGFSITETTDLTKISAAAKAAGTIPTIAASKTTLPRSQLIMDTPLWAFKALPSSSITRMPESKSYRSRISAAASVPCSFGRL
jgi:hypothetical protein